MVRSTWTDSGMFRPMVRSTTPTPSALTGDASRILRMPVAVGGLSGTLAAGQGRGLEDRLAFDPRRLVGALGPALTRGSLRVVLCVHASSPLRSGRGRVQQGDQA